MTHLLPVELIFEKDEQFIAIITDVRVNGDSELLFAYTKPPPNGYNGLPFS